MRLFALGDIHGCYDALTALEAAVAPIDDDLIVAVGDYVDRGPNSAAVLDWAIERHAAGRLVALRGNHERMMLDARHDLRARHAWLLYGGEAALTSYSDDGRPAALAAVPERHWRFLEQDCLNWFETDTHFFVHANVLPNIPLDEQPEAVLLWQRFYDVQPHDGGKTMICGHTPQESGRPTNLGYAVCIDTWVYNSGWLTCLDVASGEYWQANQQGEVRSGQLEEPEAGR